MKPAMSGTPMKLERGDGEGAPSCTASAADAAISRMLVLPVVRWIAPATKNIVILENAWFAMWTIAPSAASGVSSAAPSTM